MLLCLAAFFTTTKSAEAFPRHELQTVTHIFEAKVVAKHHHWSKEDGARLIYGLEIGTEHLGDIQTDYWAITTPRVRNPNGIVSMNSHNLSFAFGEHLLIVASTTPTGKLEPLYRGIFSRLPRRDGSSGAYLVGTGGWSRAPLQSPCRTGVFNAVDDSAGSNPWGMANSFSGFVLEVEQICSWNQLSSWAKKTGASIVNGGSLKGDAKLASGIHTSNSLRLPEGARVLPSERDIYVHLEEDRKKLMDQE